jgi:type IV pilus assembly protein PilB
MPTLHGEKVVLRILSKDTNHIDLNTLGFTALELKVYLENIKKPNGIVLISGPTGSGKTTTLYATLKLLNNPNTNILTVEDPIEYTLEGINQVQLKENIGLDFPFLDKTQTSLWWVKLEMLTLPIWLLEQH